MKADPEREAWSWSPPKWKWLGVDGVLMVAVTVVPNSSSVTGSGQEIEDQVAL